MRARIAFAIGFALAACAPPREAPPADGRLPATVTPLAYALTLDVDPRSERFSGEARIDLKFARPTTGFWLHGEGLTVSRATLKTGAGELNARYEESAARLGWAYVELARSAPAGEAELTITYDAAFATSVTGLYRMKQGGVGLLDALAQRRGSFTTKSRRATKVHEECLRRRRNWIVEGWRCAPKKTS